MISTCSLFRHTVWPSSVLLARPPMDISGPWAAGSLVSEPTWVEGSDAWPPNPTRSPLAEPAGQEEVGFGGRAPWDTQRATPGQTQVLPLPPSRSWRSPSCLPQSGAPCPTAPAFSVTRWLLRRTSVQRRGWGRAGHAELILHPT